MEAVKAQLGSTAQDDQALKDWIAWALQQADALDPLAPGSHCAREDGRGSPSKYGEAESKPETLELVWGRMLRRSRVE